MSSEDVLAALKFVGPVIALASALWSTTQKITFEDAGGVKRLTFQGRVLIGITVLATLVSLLALGLEIIVRKQQAQADARRQAAARREERDKEARAKAAAAADRQTAALARLEQDAKEQNRFLEQRFLIVSNAAEQQRRDAEISQRIARESNRRLEEAQRTFAEFERINYPLRKIEAGVALELNFAGVPLDRFWRDLETRTDLDSRPITRGDNDPLRRVVSFTRDQVRFDNQAIAYATGGTDVFLRFLDIPLGNMRNGSGDSVTSLAAGFGGKSAVGVELEPDRLEADLAGRTIVAYYEGTYEPDVAGLTFNGAKLSLFETRKLVPVLTLRRKTDKLPSRKRQPDRLLWVHYNLNDLDRFNANPESLAVTGMVSFRLGPGRSE